MNRDDIQLLQFVRSYPAVSILMPTHRRRPENQQDPIRVKNLVNQATERLRVEFSKRELAPVLARLDALVAGIDYQHALDGLALFVNHDFARKFYLPFPVRERVMVDQTFATRDLVFALNRSPRYWVLALSEQPTRLFEGARDTLIEVSNRGFPMTYIGPGVTEPLPGGKGVNKSAYRDDRARQFFRQVDAAFSRVAATTPLPLALAGVDRNLAFYDEITAHRNLVLATLTGNYDKTSGHELAKLLWPLAQEGLAKQRQEVFVELESAIGAQLYASGIDQVWRAVQEGRGDVLLVEENFHYPARLSADQMGLTPADDFTGPDFLDDAVDELIETVLGKGGRAVFVDDGTLAQHQRVALILRY
jgi:hypothetical protein